jgi:hypothetical protein
LSRSHRTILVIAAFHRHVYAGRIAQGNDIMAEFVAIYGSLAVLCSALAGIIAYIKRRDPSYWIGTSFLFPPAVIMLLLMKKNEGARPVRKPLDHDDKTDSIF